MAVGPFHGANLVAFTTLSDTVRTALTAAKYKFYVRESAYLQGVVRARAATVATKEIEEAVRAIPGLDDLVHGGFTLTIESVAPVVMWTTTYDTHTVKIVFTA